MCRAVCQRPAPIAIPTRGSSGGIASIPAISPLAMDGTAPISTTK
jgi:hypothetical protein